MTKDAEIALAQKELIFYRDVANAQRERAEKAEAELSAERARQQGLIAKWRADGRRFYSRCADELEAGQ